MAAPHLSLDDRKQSARAAARLVLPGCDPSLGTLVGDRVLASRMVAPGIVVAGFWPLGQEIDISPLLRTLRGAGHVVVLPRTPRRGMPLAFHRWSATDSLVRERFGTMTSDGPAVLPDLLLVPMLAFDRRGARLGYGGGYYDRTLAARPMVPAIGVAYAAQEWPELPCGPTDIALRHIVTEREWITP